MRGLKMKARLRLVIEPPLSLRLRLLSLRRAFRERLSPEFRLPLVVLLPESFRGGCSFGTGNLRTGFSQQGRGNYRAERVVGKGECRRRTNFCRGITVQIVICVKSAFAFRQ